MTLLDGLSLDMRQALRFIQHHKVWTAITVVTLALGIAPLTAMVSVVDHVYAPPAFDRPEEMVYSHARDAEEYERLRDHNSTLNGLLMYGREGHNVADVLSPKGTSRIEIEYISGNYFSVLGVASLRGRTISPGDDQPSAPPVVMISEPYWERAYDRSPNAIGQTIEVDRRLFTIVGVWPNHFVDITGEIDRDTMGATPQRPDIMMPWVHHPKLWMSPQIAGRRNPGFTLAQVNADTVRLRQAESGQKPRVFSERHFGIRGIVDAYSGSKAVVLPVIVILLIGFFGTPLFLACANIATYLASRAEDRRVEIAMRISLGASRSRLIRQLLIENLFIATLAASLSVIATYWWTRILANPPFTYYGSIEMNWRVLAFVAGLIFPVTLACGLIPATDVTKSAADLLRTFSAHFSRKAKSDRTRALIAIQVALSFFGFVCSGLMLRAVGQLGVLPSAYRVENVATFRIDPNANGSIYDRNQSKALYEQVVNAVSSIPGVQSVSFTDDPLTGTAPPTVRIVARDAGGLLKTSDATWLGVDSRFFQTMGMRFSIGGPFDASDNRSTRGVVINDSLAHVLFGNENPLGKQFGRGSAQLDAFEVSGVIKDTEPSAATPMAWGSYVCCLGAKYFAVHAAGSPSHLLRPIQDAVRGVSPNLTVNRLTIPQNDIVADYQTNNRPWRLILSYYAGLATVLVVTGVFSLMCHSVARRTREIGIRMAIGAHPLEMLKTILAEANKMVIPGVILGLAVTLAVGRSLNSVFGPAVPGIDIPVIIAATILMFVVASLAGYLPARRASRVDPMVALRHD